MCVCVAGFQATLPSRNVKGTRGWRTPLPHSSEEVVAISCWSSPQMIVFRGILSRRGFEDTCLSVSEPEGETLVSGGLSRWLHHHSRHPRQEQVGTRVSS